MANEMSAHPDVVVGQRQGVREHRRLAHLQDGAEMAPTLIAVYLDDGRVYEYDVPTPNKGREHAAAIVRDGYRHTADGEMEHYPPHRILKVKVSGGVETSYPDRERGT